MTLNNYEAMNIDQLREYILNHREDINAFHLYIDRSKSSGRMIIIDQTDPKWEEHLEHRIRQKTLDQPTSN